MGKIRITLTMTDEEAEWLWNLLVVEEDYPWTKFFMRLRGVIDRARERHLTRA
jgi:hypothetical protein